MPGGTLTIPTTAVMLLAASGLQCSLAAIAWHIPDIVAASGAFLAAAIALLEAKDKGRPLRYQISVLLSSIAIGSTVPGAVVSFYWPEKFSTLVWHVWALAGFGAGLCGWSVVYGVLRVAQRKAPAAIDRPLTVYFRVFPGLKTPDPSDPKVIEDNRRFNQERANRRRRYDP